MDQSPFPPRARRSDRPRRIDRLTDRGLALMSIVGFWGFYTAIITLRAAVMDFPEQGELFVRRLVVSLIGVALTMLLWLVLAAVRDRSLGRRVGTAFLGAIPVAVLVAASNYWIFNVYDPVSLIDEAKQAGEIAAAPWQEIAEISFSRYFFVAAWASFYLAASYARDVQRAERAASRYARAAQAAELRALRYQINPHFLFNTLNSLSSLVLAGRAAEAETMIMNLATFYRSTLADDPLGDTTLADEVAMQQRYLAIEQVRYPDRLTVVIDVPEPLAQLRLPGLILQPIVENAIRHGVAVSRRAVTLRIAARQRDDRIEIDVEDDAVHVPAEGGRHASGGIGLANVRDRLEARFGAAARLEAGPLDGGGFRTKITLSPDGGPLA